MMTIRSCRKLLVETGNRRANQHGRSPRTAMARQVRPELLEERCLLSTVYGRVLDDLNGNALADVGEPGLNGVAVDLSAFNTATGQSTLVATSTSGEIDVNHDGKIDPLTESGLYQFGNVAPGTYQLTETPLAGQSQTFPTAEHIPRSYFINVTPGHDAGAWPSSALAAPSDNWLASLPAGAYTMPLSGDFMFQFGQKGIAPSRVSFSGEATLVTNAPVTTEGSGGETASTTTVGLTVSTLVLHGTISSDQHEQGYLGPITMTLSTPSFGQITSRKDSAALADSNLDVNATIEIPNAFGTPTTLHTAVPITFLAREIARFPAIGSSYQYRGTQPPISLLDSSGTEQGQLFFASLNPMSGYDFGNYTAATVHGRAYIDSDGNGAFNAGDIPLANQAIVLQQIAEISGPTGEEGEGGSNGSGGPPDGKGEQPAAPITVYTDSTGSYTFSNLGPGSYTLSQPDGIPLELVTPSTQDNSYTIDPLISGSSTAYDFRNTFTASALNHATAPGYPDATHVIVPNLHLGASAFANAPGSQAYLNDGVHFGAALTPGAIVPMTVTVVVPEGRTAYLTGWLDAKGDGTFAAGDGPADHGEQIQLSGDLNHPFLSDYAVGEGIHTLHLSMVVPADVSLTAGQLATYARFRLSTTTGLGPDDASQAGASIADGEVEDIPVTIYDAAQLGTIQGQTFEDINGNGQFDPGEPAMDGWKITLINLTNGQVAATGFSAPDDISIGGSTVTVHGLYHFSAVMPGRYEVRATPPTDMGSIGITAPGSEEESAVVYRFDITPGETVGTNPYDTIIASPGWLNNLAAGTDTLFALGQFMLINGTGGHAGSGGNETGESSESGEAGESGGPIHLSVVGPATIYHGTISNGLVPTEITGLRLEGIAVTESEEGGPTTVLGPVTVTLGIFPSAGTIGASSGAGSGEETSDSAAFSLYMEFDLTSLGLGKLVNTRPLNVSGTVTQMPMVGTTLARTGGGSPIPLRDSTTGLEPLRLVTASLTTMFGLDYGAALLGSISGNVFEDANGDNVRQDGENGLAGATVVVEQVDTEEGSTGGEGGNGQGGGEESTPPPVYLTTTDANGNWMISDLLPGSYKVTVIPPASYGVSDGAGTGYTVTVQSRSQLGNIDFGNYPINDPPVISAPTQATTDEGVPLVFSAANGNSVSISDPDAGTHAVRITLDATGGALTLSTSAGLTFQTGDGTADGQIVAEGSIAAINTALEGLRFTPTVHTSGTGTLSISVNDLGNSGFGGSNTTNASVSVTIVAVADAPNLAVADAIGQEDKATTLDISASLVDTDGSESLSVTIAGLPKGAKLSAGTDVGGGTWLLTPDQLTGLKVTLATHAHGTFPLTVTATAKEASNGVMASTVRPLVLNVAAVADAPTLSVADAVGVEHALVPLKITSALVDSLGSESLSITVKGLPASSRLTAGTNLGGGTWVLTPAQLPGLGVVSPVSGTYTLTVTATSKEASNGDVATTARTLTLRLADTTPMMAGLFGASVYQDVPTPFNLGRFGTPGTHGPWIVTVNWGDSSPQTTFATATPGDLGTRNHTYMNAGDFQVGVSVTDQDGHIGTGAFPVHVIGHASLESVTVNDGAPQRSQVKSVTVTFNGAVDWAPGAFELRTRSGRRLNPRAIRLNVTRFQTESQTLAILTFSGIRTLRGSLPNGRYQLAILGDQIHDPTGYAVDANSDGIPGGRRSVPFFRLAGDFNGDGRVNWRDRIPARTSLSIVRVPAVTARTLRGPRG